MNGRLGDFGLAKLYEHGTNPGTTRVMGTLGYLAPELTKTGKPTASSDVFAFEAFLLQVVCGRRPIEPKAWLEEFILVDWVWDKWKTGAIIEVVDPRLRGEYDEIEVIVVLKLGLMCSNNEPRYHCLQCWQQLISLMRKKGGNGSEFDYLVHLCPPSSYYEKIRAWSMVDDGDGNGDVDLETGCGHQHQPFLGEENLGSMYD